MMGEQEAENRLLSVGGGYGQRRPAAFASRVVGIRAFLQETLE
jgi:hypothetical protein